MSKRAKAPWIAIVVLQVVQLLSLVPWLPMAGLSVMAFDAPGSTEMWQPWTFVLAIWSYPLWLLAAGIVSWTLYAFRWTKTAIGIAVAFALPMPVLLAVIVVANWLG